MAYKFQFGTTKLSGSTTFEEAVVGESTISGSGRVSGKELILDAVGVIGTSTDVDLLQLSEDRLDINGDLSSSLDLNGRKLMIMQNGTIGVNGDADLITLARDSVSVAGALSASGQVDLPGAVRFGTENQTTVSAVGVISSSAANDFEGVLRFGAGQQTTVSAAGVISSSAENTIYKATINRIVVDDADINGGAIDNATVGATTQSSGKFTTLSSSAALTSLNLTTDKVTAATVDLNAGTIDNTAIGGTTPAAAEFTTLSASSTLSVEGASSFGPGALTTISAAGVISGSGDSTLHLVSSNQLIFGSASLNGPQYLNKNAMDATSVDEIMGLTTGSLLYHDEATGLMKLGSFSSYASAIAGTGITATNGVLSVDTTGGDSMTATHVPAAEAGNFVLSTGINYMTTEVTGSSLLILPSGSAGDVVIVKAPAGVSSTNYVKISSSVGQADEIDGFSEARIESPHGAVSMVYSNSDGKWVIY